MKIILSFIDATKGTLSRAIRLARWCRSLQLACVASRSLPSPPAVTTCHISTYNTLFYLFMHWPNILMNFKNNLLKNKLQLVRIVPRTHHLGRAPPAEFGVIKLLHSTVQNVEYCLCWTLYLWGTRAYLLLFIIKLVGYLITTNFFYSLLWVFCSTESTVLIQYMN